MKLRDLMFLHGASVKTIVGPNLFDIHSFDDKIGITVDGNAIQGNSNAIASVSFGIADDIQPGERFRVSFTAQNIEYNSMCSISLRADVRLVGRWLVIIINGKDAKNATHFEVELINKYDNVINGFQFGYNITQAWRIEDIEIHKITKG